MVFRAENHFFDGAGEIDRGVDLMWIGYAPQPDGAISGNGSYKAAILTESCSVNVVTQYGDLTSVGYIPQSDGLICADGSEGAPIGAEFDTVNSGTDV